MAPSWLLPPLIVLATAATIIASQAVISGVFSVTRQALNLGYLPRVRILHSSETEIGQIYVPSMNWILFAGTVLLVATPSATLARNGRSCRRSRQPQRQPTQQTAINVSI